jgi:DNA-binding transcriptional regulator YhcF (GntR family)
MTKLSPKAKAIMDVFDNEYYHKAKLRQVAIAATLRELIKELKYIGITEKNILEIVDELENL